jgi:hypothetical protein
MKIVLTIINSLRHQIIVLMFVIHVFGVGFFYFILFFKKESALMSLGNLEN